MLVVEHEVLDQDRRLIASYGGVKSITHTLASRRLVATPLVRENLPLIAFDGLEISKQGWTNGAE